MPPKLVMAAFLKNKIKFGPNSIEQNIHFHSGVWNSAQYSYSIIKKKKKLSIVLCISKFQNGVDCKSAKHVLEKDVQNKFLNNNKLF